MKNIIRLSANVSVVKQMEAEGSEKPEKTYAKITGIANATTVDRIGDLIPKDAWQLANYLKNPVMLWEHMGCHPIGKVLTIEPRDEGLYFEADIGSQTEEITEKQEEVISLLRQGILKSFSVGFIPKATERRDDIFMINEAEVLEISLVSVPMNQDSLLTSLKSIENMGNESQNASQPASQGAANGGSMEEMKAVLAAICEDVKGCVGKLDKICGKMFPENEEKPEEDKPQDPNVAPVPDVASELSALKDELATMKSALEKANKDNDTLCEAIVQAMHK